MTEKETRKEIQNVISKYEEKNRHDMQTLLEWQVEDKKISRNDKNLIYNAMSDDEVVRTIGLFNPGYEQEKIFETFMEDMMEHMDISRLKNACKIMRDKEVLQAVIKYRMPEDENKNSQYSPAALWFSKVAIFLQDKEQTKEFIKTVDSYYGRTGSIRLPHEVMYALAQDLPNMRSEIFTKIFKLFGTDAFVENITRVASQMYDSERNDRAIFDRTLEVMLRTLAKAIEGVNADEEVSYKMLDSFVSAYEYYSKSASSTYSKAEIAHDSAKSAADLIRHGVIKAPKEVLQDRQKLLLLVSNLNPETDIEKLHISFILDDLARDGTSAKGAAMEKGMYKKLQKSTLSYLLSEIRFRSDFDQGDGERAILASVPMSMQNFIEFEKFMNRKLAELRLMDKNTANAIGYEYTVEGYASNDGNDAIGVLSFHNHNVYCYDEEFNRTEKVIKDLWKEAVMNYAPKEVWDSLASQFRGIMRK
ncbi:MAG: hypothetical protein QW478_14250 [Candidatus Micrarchaeaceae archaeon]